MTTRSLLYLRLAIIGLALCCPPSSFAGQELAIAGTAKVKPEQARSIALKARPGAITSEEEAAAVFATPSWSTKFDVRRRLCRWAALLVFRVYVDEPGVELPKPSAVRAANSPVAIA